MTEQLALIEPKLTERQAAALERRAYALEQVRRAGDDGLASDELGALLHERNGSHSRDDRCRWCGKEGRRLAVALNEAGLIRYRAQLKVWQLVEIPEAQPTPAGADHAGPGPVPFGSFPAGY